MAINVKTKSEFNITRTCKKAKEKLDRGLGGVSQYEQTLIFAGRSIILMQVHITLCILQWTTC